jgi:predicted RNA-binding protein with PUA-like domain
MGVLSVADGNHSTHLAKVNADNLKLLPGSSSLFSLVSAARLGFRRAMPHWLIKSEPDVFSIADLARVGCEPWTGVRNYQARNYMWNAMQPGDLALFYHSNAKPPGIVGIARVAGPAKPDPTQFEDSSEYYDPKATPAKPRWWMVDFEYVATFSKPLALEELKADPELSAMVVCQRGSRLSITPVTDAEYARACQLGDPLS